MAGDDRDMEQHGRGHRVDEATRSLGRNLWGPPCSWVTLPFACTLGGPCYSNRSDSATLDQGTGSSTSGGCARA
jgi:hypothetical protein